MKRNFGANALKKNTGHTRNCDHAQNAEINLPKVLVMKLQL